MKTAGAGLISILNNNPSVFIADLYTFTMNDGTIVKYTNADQNIGAFISGDLLFARNGIRIIAGVEVDTLNLKINYPPNSTFVYSLQNGAMDGARVLVERAIMTTWGDISNGTIIMFSGRVSNSDFDRTTANIIVKSDFELLNIKMPRNLYQPSCSHSLYSVGCGVTKASFTKTYTIISATTTSITANILEISGVYDQGVILFTSGANAGVKRTVKSQINGSVSIALPLAYAPAIGDTFQISQGCDKTMGTCGTKFNNLNNFRGYPFLPRPELAR